LAVLSNNPLAERVAAQIAPLLPPHSSILIGLSGGVDSVVLLHLLHLIAPRFSWKLSALHVHHGISRNAGAWANFCATLCARYGIPLHVEHVDIAPLRGHGIEAAARKLRHAAFAAQECDYVALAHHADDQAETLLLQLLRGAGVRGASAMPVLSLSKRPVLSQSKWPLLAGREGSPALIRPLLDFSRQEILGYAAAHELQWIEDESNADDSYPRNFLRHRVLPLLEQKFPACRDTLARSARHFAEASSLLDELAQLDAAQAMHADTLDAGVLRSLSLPRAKNLLRYFLHRLGAPMPQTAQMDDMLQQLCGARRDAAVCIEYGGGYALGEGGCWQVRRYRGRVYVMRALAGFDQNLALPWKGEAGLEWAALNARLKFGRSESGISLAKLQRAPVTLRLRCGGETLRPFADGPARTLKNLLQEHHIPPWQRERLPLLYCGDDLVCVPGVAIAAEYLADGQESAIRFELS
jgi:tRNA(Ile)-lysidine synthase